MAVAVCYPDKYPVEETFQLLKTPWEWYRKDGKYDVVIARKADVPGYRGPLIDLTENDLFRQISVLLNTGKMHLHEPECDLLIDRLRQELKKYCFLCEIPPAPWGHPYLVALTHDVDATSARECRLLTIGNAAFGCVRQGNVSAGFQLLAARCGAGPDPWDLFGTWKSLEERLGVRSTFFFVPKRDDPGIKGHTYRKVYYAMPRDVAADLESNGWETGIHGIDNWADAAKGKEEIAALGKASPGNRTHWLLFDRNSWNLLDAAGYSYDSSFGYNDDAGFRAGTLQVYRPERSENLLELPLHIQDIGLFGKSCWAPTGAGWEQVPCLGLDETAAREYADRIFSFARRFGGVVTLLWHYENIAPPRDWSEMYRDLVARAQAEGAWVTTAGNVVAWFRKRRQAGMTCTYERDAVTIRAGSVCLPSGSLPSLTLRIHIPLERRITVDTECSRQNEYTDIKLDREIITVTFS